MNEKRLTLGEFILALRRANQEKRIRYAFMNTEVGTFHSYRGYYEDIAIGSTAYSGTEKKVADVLRTAETAIGLSFCGYKGGSYVMGGNSRLWVANYGETTQTGISGVTEDEQNVFIETCCVPW